MQLFQGLHPTGKGALQARARRHAKTVGLNPVDQAGHHQIGGQEGILGLLRHRPREVHRSNLRLGQIVMPGLFELQVQQATQAQTHRRNKDHRRLAQG
ncbi:hypothetical protein D3C81_1921730 [compost metagenome]